MYPIIATVRYYDETDNNNLHKINILTYGENLAAVVSYIEEEYCDGVESISAVYAGFEGCLFEVPDYIADILNRGDGNYDVGLSRLTDNVAKNLENK